MARLSDVHKRFPAIEDCISHLESLRWNGRPQCPYCPSTKSTRLRNEARYHCSNCDSNFSVTVRTLFHGTHVAFRKWYLLIALVMESRKLPTVATMAAAIHINKNTVTRMVDRIRAAASRQDEFNLLVRITEEVTKDD